MKFVPATVLILLAKARLSTVFIRVRNSPPESAIDRLTETASTEVPNSVLY